jgi:hypothetical protein
MVDALRYFYRFGFGSVGATSTQGQGADAPTTRAAQRLGSAQSKHTGVKSPGFFTSLRGRSEPKPKINDPFLKQALRRGGDRSNAAMLSALVNMKEKGEKIDCEGLTEDQKSRLRDSLVNHGELLAAIKATIRDIEYSGKAPGAFQTCLVELRTSLEEVYRAVGCETVVELQGSERKRDQLRKVLLEAWQMSSDDVATPKERIDQKLKEMKENPAAFLVEPTPRVELDVDMVRRLIADSMEKRKIGLRELEELIRYAMRHCGETFPKKSFDTYFNNFRTAPSESRDRFLETILHALQADRTWGALNRTEYLNDALGQLETVQNFRRGK